MAAKDAQSEAFLASDTISDEFFIDIVEKKLKLSRDKFKVRLVLLSPATGKNENYVSVLYRAKIKIEMIDTKEKTSVDVIIKALLTTMKEMKEFSVFPRERLIYEKVLRRFEKIWLDRTGEIILFGPQSIKFETDPYEVIVLDDLKAENFEMMNRKVGLDLAQTKMLLSKLAKFHATSAISYQTDGIIHPQFDRKGSMPNFDDNAPMVDMFGRVLDYLVDAVRGYGGCELYADKLAKWDKGRILNLFTDVAVPMRCGFQVLNHGDTWLNNMMFKSDEEGNPIEVSLIDYQMSFWATPSADFLYFMMTSVIDEVKVAHFDDLVEHYHEQLSTALRKLKFDQHIPTLAEFHIDLIEKGYFGCSCIMFLLFIVKYDSEDEMNMEVMMSGGLGPELMDRIYNNPIYKKALMTWLPFLNKRGILDILIKEDPIEGKTEE